MHLTNRGICYISNGTNPNTLGIVPTFNLGRCVSEDGTQEWNYNSALSLGSRWVLKTNGSASEHWFLLRPSNSISMEHSTPVIFEFTNQFSLQPSKLELIAPTPITGLKALQNLTGIVNGFINLISPVSGDIFTTIKANSGGIFSMVRDTLTANTYKTIPVSVPFSMITNDTIRLELRLGGAIPAGSHLIQFGECRLNFSVLT